MVEIPYYFKTPIPQYFFEMGWIDPKKSNYHKVLAFLTWSFARCNRFAHLVCFDNKEFELQPFEFICGRVKCAEETALTEDIVRTLIDSFIKAGLLEKTPNSVPKRFNCYKWVISRFPKSTAQRNPPQVPLYNPTLPHKRDEETKRELDIKDVSLGGCGNVHNLLDAITTSTEEHEDFFKLAFEFIFEDGSKISERILMRWWSTYGPEETSKSLQYYKKMANKEPIRNPEAYIESCLKNRYWETDELRIQCKERELALKTQKTSWQVNI